LSSKIFQQTALESFSGRETVVNNECLMSGPKESAPRRQCGVQFGGYALGSAAVELTGSLYQLRCRSAWIALHDHNLILCRGALLREAERALVPDRITVLAGSEQNIVKPMQISFIGFVSLVPHLS